MKEFEKEMETKRRSWRISEDTTLVAVRSCGGMKKAKGARPQPFEQTFYTENNGFS